MSDERRNARENIHIRQLPGKIFTRRNLTRAGVVLLLLGVLGGGGYMLANGGLLDKFTGGKTVKFQQFEEENIPQVIVKEIIPEYRELERALGCVIDGKVYVVVTRGEKPTAGFGLKIDEMKLEKTDAGENLVVRALFTDPPDG